MRMPEVIQRKRRGESLTTAEIRQVVQDYVSGTVPDYQMSALAMAICFQGMDHRETADLTMAMAESGEQLNWRDLPGIKVDKHSTGGVGDTTTLVLAPLVAAAGAPVVKMSGRGLGHTGGTIDKLESIPGFRTTLELAAFKAQVQTIGVAIAGQTAALAPADKKLYALRDVTATVESLPLIASSIMSKKLAGGADRIVLDVKVGAGAFMKNLDDARRLAQAMVRIGQATGREVIAVLTRMDEPLGMAIGNALEVREAIATLRGAGPPDLTEICLTLGAQMLVLAGKATDVAEAQPLLLQLLQSGAALAKFRALVAAQGGNPAVVDEPSLLPQAPVVRYYEAPAAGVITAWQAESLGLIAMRLGAGRAAHGDVINPAVGLVLRRKIGQAVKAGEVLAEVHAATAEAAASALAEVASCVEIGAGPEFSLPLVLEVITQTSLGSQDAGAVLLAAAREAREHAYAPYSDFAVGAALRLSDGRVVSGCNVENAAYGMTSCAERNAVFSAISAGYLHGDVHIAEVAVVADSPQPVAPCGACRQVLAEFSAPTTPVYLGNVRGDVQTLTVGELLPHAFSSAYLGGV